MLMELPKTPIVNVHTTENRGFTPEEIKKKGIFSLTYYKVIDEIAERYNKSLASHVYSDNPKIEGHNE